MTARTRLVFVRHGQAEGVHGRCIGQCDVPLSAEGIASVCALSLHTVLDAAPVDAIVSSDLCRASATARIIARSLKRSFTTDVRLRELSFGDWDGQSWSALEQTDARRLSAWMHDWMNAAPPNGETVRELADRVQEWLRETLADGSHQDRTIVVVAHAGSIRAALCLLNARPLDQMFSIPVPYATAIMWEPRAGQQLTDDTTPAAIRENRDPHSTIPHRCGT